MENITIRRAIESDIGQLLRLCQEHAEYENACYTLHNQKLDLVEAIFCSPFRLYCWVAESTTGLIGYCTYSLEYSTWKAANYIHMDCLYLEESLRNRGLGKLLMEKIIIHARQLNIDEIQWQTPEMNTSAIRFYTRIGASSKKKVRFFLNPLEFQVSK